MATKWMIWMTELSSRKSICRLTGRFSHSKWSRFVIPRFAKAYGITLDEAEKEIKEYRTLNEFFTRRLKQGMRPICQEPGGVVSPVDALITAMGKIQSSTILNVKGQDYSIDELLNHSPRSEAYRNGYAYVLYLSPTDYHRIHVPVGGRKLESEHIPGRVYPVNDFGMTNMRSVLSRNERLITYISHEYGETAVVKVGAMNVSSIKYVDNDAKEWERGDELAYFEFGSTVVLLMQKNFHPLSGLDVGSKVKVGTSLGHFHNSESSQ
ncbi:archaetidylserine decarboxylase [Paenibacillus motobuensis]|uniref:archaetidylserine decarboxylase n=1 Tax=Paenibacillus TaxID=44249 RepID=UPI002040B9EB|nr:MULTISPECIES: archaetidylserine decarboxylase [Paenibacillus]MCM3041848.1 archaetidylserine decarboxylase [Paenibacillus lutimineralis]MCM3648952.1 archaetidylserine decarboxylase [Paenibacillus motobuensis]